MTNAAKLREEFIRDYAIGPRHDPINKEFIAATDALLAAVRDEALEEAAKVADADNSTTGRDIYEKIRALKGAKR
jgi:hypothetical protein